MNIALILSGGSGKRTGGRIPKQYVEAGGMPVIAYCLDVFEKHGEIDAIQVVADGRWHEQIQGWLGTKWRGFSVPGPNRQMSVLNGLDDILQFAHRMDKVIIHDAARPFVTDELITACIRACETHDGAMPVLPAKDTMYLHDGKRVTSLTDRGCLCAGQAPEAYILGKYYDANMALMPDKILEISGSTEAAFLAGMDIAVIPGDESNFKITTEKDMKLFLRMVKHK